MILAATVIMLFARALWYFTIVLVHSRVFKETISLNLNRNEDRVHTADMVTVVLDAVEMPEESSIKTPESPLSSNSVNNN